MFTLTIEDNKKVFYIADTHFGHANIIKHCNRPFESADEMDNTLIDNWNNVVGKDDIVIVVGDFAFKGATHTEYLAKLNGKIYLVRGNHDKSAYGFEKAVDMMKIKHKGNTIVLCHYPMCEWDGFFRNTVHFYGHIHNAKNNTNSLMESIPNAYNVGADILGFTPRTFEEITKK